MNNHESESTNLREADITIVGAGLVGASLACAIAQLPRANRLKILLVEAGQESQEFSGENFDPRVVALTQASQKLFERIGLWQAIEQTRACAYRDMHVWDGEGTAEIHFNAGEVRVPQLGHIVENSVIVKHLRERLAAFPNIQLIQPAALENLQTHSQYTSVLLNNGVQINTQLLFAADGAQSRVRELAEFETREWDYNHTAIVTTVQTELPHQHTAWQRFMRTGPLAFLPLPSVNGKHFCSIVWSAEPELAAEIMALDDAQFCVRLGRAFENKLGGVLQSAQRFAIPLRQRHAKDYIKPGIALVGDAAHNIHPLAGQGVNLGLLDVVAITQEIERALARQLPLNDFSILRRYQRARMAGNLSMMAAMETFKRLFASRSLMVTWIRNLGMRQVNNLSELKKIIVKSAMGLE